ncbi:hypothetical protein PENTCL1PPCAC_14861, partial [Pristionchus entomophagus]
IISIQHVTSAVFSCMTIPFALMNLHFLYRYWTMKRPSSLIWFSKFRYFVARTVGLDDTPEALDARRAAFRIQYDDDAIHGWLILDHWRNDRLNVWAFVVILIACCIMVPSFTVAATLASLTYRYIRRAKTLSSGLRSVQMKILVAVCAQV